MTVHIIINSQIQIQGHSQQKNIQTQLRPIISDHFMKTTIPSEMTIKAFREKHGLIANRCNVFLELRNITLKGNNIIDVILMDTEVQVRVFM